MGLSTPSPSAPRRAANALAASRASQVCRCLCLVGLPTPSFAAPRRAALPTPSLLAVRLSTPSPAVPCGPCSPRLMGLSTPLPFVPCGAADALTRRRTASPFAPRGAADALTRHRTARHGRTQGSVSVERARSPVPGGTLTKLQGGGRWIVCKQHGAHKRMRCR